MVLTPLTPTELRVLRFSARGLNAAETGGEMHLSVETIKTHRKRAIAKFGARNTAHAIALAFVAGELGPEDLEA